MPGNPIQFNCGEYRPGQQPLSVGGLRPPVTTVLIIEPGTPQIPNFPHIPSGRPVGPVNPTGPGGPGGGSVGDPSSTGPVGPSTGGPAGPGSVTPAGTGPTTGGEARYRCSDTIRYCPEDLGLPVAQRRIRDIVRNCVICHQIRDPETGNLFWENDCIYPTLVACQNACHSQTLSQCISIPQTGSTGVVQTNQGEISHSNTQVVGTNSPTHVVGSINPTLTVNVVTEAQNPNVVVSLEPSGGIYNNLFNLFRSEVTPQTSMVGNSLYPNIFNTSVASEVLYVLTRIGSNIPWSEWPLQNLTNDKIAISLNRRLLTAFNNIHYPGGLRVEVNFFLEMVKRHLLTGTIDSFDPNYYIDLSNRQSGDTIIQYTSTNVREYLERAALGLIANASVIADSSQSEEIQKNQLKRQRRLNTDINSEILVCPIDEEGQYMPLENDGICSIVYGVGLDSIANGAGDGYYIDTNTVDGGCVSFQTRTDVSAAYYVPADVRFNALKLFGEDPAVILTAASQGESNEFLPPPQVLDDLSEIVYVPLYFKLSLSSVEDVITRNPLINKTQATYELITDQDEIDEHTDSNGFAVTRVNVDYADPIYRYASETSSISIVQNDITFRNFTENRTNVNRSIITRNIPFGIILTPTHGSKFNPFNGFSRLDQFESSAVRRSVRLLPSIQYADNEQKQSELQEVNLANETGDFRVGLDEPLDGQNITYRFDPTASNLVNTFFSGGGYTSAIPAASAYGMSHLITNVLDPLIAEHDPEELTWWDIYRRLPMNKFGEFLYDYNESLHASLAQGYRSDVKIRNVLGRMDVTNSNILDDDDSVILTERDRVNAQTY